MQKTVSRADMSPLKSTREPAESSCTCFERFFVAVFSSATARGAQFRGLLRGEEEGSPQLGAINRFFVLVASAKVESSDCADRVA